MLIPYDEVVKILASYDITVRGVLHIGAHECEELGAYTQNGIHPGHIVWVEANPEIVDRMRCKGILVHNAAILDKEIELPFHITNNGQSSSLLEFGTHAQNYPWCVVSNTITVKTQRLDTFIKKNNIQIKQFNFWNLDIQGCELAALKSAGNMISYADAIYCEVNTEEVYKGCGLLTDMDSYLLTRGFIRHSLSMTGAGWGDALYIKKVRGSVSVQLEGRLGNQLFEIAACAAHAARMNMPFYIENRGYRHPYLSHLESIYIDNPSSVTVWKEPHHSYAPIPSAPCHLLGYYQSGKYFNDQADYIRTLLSPRMLATVHAKYGALLAQSDSIVLHIRRGDYRTPNYKENFGILGRQYYRDAVQRMRSYNPSGKLLLFSDDPEYCRGLLLDDNAHVIDEPNDTLALTLMTQFSYFIISNSSFSWWAAWLSSAKHVIAPDTWFNPAFIADYQDVCEPEWEKIPVGEPDAE